MHSLARHPETHTAKRTGNADDDQVDDGHCDLPRRREVHALVHEEPHDRGETEREPAGEKSSLELG